MITIRALRQRSVKKLMPIASALAVAVVGSILLMATHAATTVGSIEAEAGTPATSATTIGDTTASNNSAVKFSTASVATQTNNCAPNPHLCGYPDETNTGYGATTLTNVPGQATSGTGWHWNAANKDVEIDGAGAVVSGLNIAGCVEIYASNVTFKNSKITANAGCNSVVTTIYYLNLTGIKLDHLEINGALALNNDQGAMPGIGGGSNGTIISAVNIYNVGDGIDVSDNMTIKDSYVHGQWVKQHSDGSFDHVDSLQSAGDFDLTITHNTFDNTGGNDSPIILGADVGDITNATTSNNLLIPLSGQPAIRAGHNAGSSYVAKNMQFLNNRIKGGAYNFIPDGTNVLIFSGNVNDVDGSPLANFSSKGDGTTQYRL